MATTNGATELKKWSNLFFRWWWLFVLSGLGAAVAVYVLGIMNSPPPMYASTAQVLVERRTQEPGVPFAVDIMASERLADSYVGQIGTRPFMEAVVRQLNLPYGSDELSQRVSVRNRFGAGQPANIIRITAQDRDPVIAAAIANTTAQTLISMSLARQSSQIAQLEERLAQSRRLPGAIVLGEEAPVLDVSIVEPAVPSNAPVNNPLATILMTTAVAGILALAVPGLAIILREYVDDRVKSTEELKTVAGFNLVASIPRSRGRNRVPVISLGSARRLDPFAESYNFLLTNLEFVSHTRKEVKSILVTGPGVSEGKSTTAVNLAIAAAAQGKSVILVDCDLRRPALQRVFELNGHKGLTQLLAGGSSVEQHVVASPIEGLQLLASGPPVSEPGAALASPNMKRVVQELERRADLVIIDSPALLAVPDALRLATLVDGVLFVVDAGRTTREMVAKAVDRLRQVDAYIMAAVFNRATAEQHSNEYARHYQRRYSKLPANSSSQGLN